MRGIAIIPTICSAEAISFLEQKISEIETAIVCDEEQAYISKCMDEVMEEMGYDLLIVTSVTKKWKKI